MSWQESKYRTMPLYPKMTAKPPFTIESPGAKPVEGETVPRRLPICKDGLIAKPADNISTIYELLRVSVAKMGDAKCMGSRRLLKTHQETKKVKKMIDGVEKEVDKNWTYFELSPYEYLTYNEYEALALNVGSGLRKLGMEKGDRVHIFAATSAHWLDLSKHCRCNSTDMQRTSKSDMV